MNFSNSGEFHFCDSLLGERFHFAHTSFFFRGKQCDRYTGFPCAARATNAMDVHFGIVGQVIVENMRDVVNVESARGDIGGDQYFELVGAETSKDAFAGILVEVAVNGFGGDAAHDQFVGESGGLCAGAGKDQRALDRFDLEETCERIGLVPSWTR